MSVLLVDTNVVSILFNYRHSLRQTCVEAVAGHELVISFMARAELLLWPAANNWGYHRGSMAARRSADPDRGCMDRFRSPPVGLPVGDDGFWRLCSSRGPRYRADSIILAAACQAYCRPACRVRW